MPKIISNAKYTTNLPFYNRGINKNFKQYAYYLIQNYTMIRQISRHNIENRRKRFEFII